MCLLITLPLLNKSDILYNRYLVTKKNFFLAFLRIRYILFAERVVTSNSCLATIYFISFVTILLRISNKRENKEQLKT